MSAGLGTASSQPESPVITLLTDYGLADAFVGVCHGVIAGICPQARVIDLTHGIPRHDIPAGAAVLAQSLPYLPVGVHVAIVDPTVGGERRGVALRSADGRVLVGPDNGLLWAAAQKAGGVSGAVEISNSQWRLEPVSATFHGRDIFVPVAARIAAGEAFERAGVPIDPAGLVALESAQARRRDGGLVVNVGYVDGFGNVQLTVGLAQLEIACGSVAELRIADGEPVFARLVRTFADVGDSEPMLFEDSAGMLALALNGANAAQRYRLRVGDEVLIAEVRS